MGSAEGRFLFLDFALLSSDQFSRVIWHTLGDKLQGTQAGTSPFVCTHRTHVAGIVSKLVHTKRILVHFSVSSRDRCQGPTVHTTRHDTT